MARLVKDFERRYTVVIEEGDHQAVADHFSTLVMETLLRWPGWMIESKHGHLAFSRSPGYFLPMHHRGAMVEDAITMTQAFRTPTANFQSFQAEAPAPKRESKGDRHPHR